MKKIFLILTLFLAAAVLSLSAIHLSEPASHALAAGDCFSIVSTFLPCKEESLDLLPLVPSSFPLFFAIITYLIINPSLTLFFINRKNNFDPGFFLQKIFATRWLALFQNSPNY